MHGRTRGHNAGRGTCATNIWPQKAVVNDRWVFWVCVCVCCGYDFASSGNRRCQNRKRKQSSHLASDQRNRNRNTKKKQQKGQQNHMQSAIKRGVKSLISRGGERLRGQCKQTANEKQISQKDKQTKNKHLL